MKKISKKPQYKNDTSADYDYEDNEYIEDESHDDSYNYNSNNKTTVTEFEETMIPSDINPSFINLPNQWVLYIYNKNAYKKMVNHTSYNEAPHSVLCTISTVNDLIYILQLLEVEVDDKLNYKRTNKINLNTNDYIIMRKGIEPIWEDPKNSNGGAYTIKVPSSKGYELWSEFVMYILGETFTYEMNYINGISVTYVVNDDSTLIKIWDGKPNRTLNEFKNIVPDYLLNKIMVDSQRYSPNKTKNKYGDQTIITKLQNKQPDTYRKNFRRR